ncbi:MAG: CARDB domain-containing protein, partial [Bacteroidales bacterium]
YAFYVTAVYTAPDGESNPSNQVSATVGNSNRPDLAVNNPAINPISVFPGESIDISCRVINQGTAAAGASVLKVFLSTNNTYDQADLLMADGSLEAIGAGSYLDVTGQGIPISQSTTPGNYFILFQADATSVVAESNETNNMNFTGLTVKSSSVLNPPRNLTGAVNGLNVNLAWDAPANGSTGTLSGYKLYRDGGLIATIPSPATLTYSDVNLAVKSYNYFVTATFTNPAGESGPSNQVSVTITTLAQPDLVTLNPVITPVTQHGGGNINLSFRFQNQGNTSAGASVIRVYLSKNQAYDNGDTQLAYAGMDPIGAGEYIDLTGEGITIPSTTSPGSYYVLFIADADATVTESNETNNLSFTPLAVSDPYIFNPPLNLRASVAGDKITLAWDPPAAGSSGTLSGYKVYEDGVPIGTVGSTDLGGIVSGLPPGTYKYVVTALYTSADGESAGSNEVSATISAIVGPDLLITNQWISPTAIIPGKKIDFGCKLENQGSEMAGSSVINIYLSENQTLDAGDVPLATGNIGSVNPGEAISITGNAITITRFNRPGSYFILFIADASGAVTEFYEDNNTSFVPIDLSITAGIEEELLTGNLRLFPVPANDHLAISYSGSMNEMCEVSICNLTGSILFTDKVFITNGFNYSMDTRFLESGNYFVRFRSDSETFVKQISIIH